MHHDDCYAVLISAGPTEVIGQRYDVATVGVGLGVVPSARQFPPLYNYMHVCESPSSRLIEMGLKTDLPVDLHVRARIVTPSHDIEDQSWIGVT